MNLFTDEPIFLLYLTLNQKQTSLCYGVILHYKKIESVYFLVSFKLFIKGIFQMNIRSRTQSDVCPMSRRINNRYSASQVQRSKDEFDVARTLANFSESAVNFDQGPDSQSKSSERAHRLIQLSMDPQSVISENPGSVATSTSNDQEMDDGGSDADVDVEGLEDADPLDDIEGVCDEPMDTESNIGSQFYHPERNRNSNDDDGSVRNHLDQTVGVN
jgi:hypothetical protein